MQILPHWAPVWSPDGQPLAYIAAPEEPDISDGPEAMKIMQQRRIWRMDADDTTQHPLTNHSDYRDERSHWSADSEWIVVPRLDADGAARRRLMRAAGNDLRQITDFERITM